MHLEHRMKTLTIRNVPADLAEALQRERARRGQSLNQTVLDLLHQREVRAGFRLGKQRERNDAVLREFLLSLAGLARSAETVVHSDC
jgi:hypothetical protein